MKNSAVHTTLIRSYGSLICRKVVIKFSLWRITEEVCLHLLRVAPQNCLLIFPWTIDTFFDSFTGVDRNQHYLSSSAEYIADIIYCLQRNCRRAASTGGKRTLCVRLVGKCQWYMSVIPMIISPKSHDINEYLPARMMRAAIVFGGVCLCVCPHSISKTTNQKLM